MNAVFQILERLSIVGSQIRISGQNLTQLLQAGDFRHEFFEIVATRRTLRKIRKADKFVEKAIIREMIEKIEQRIMDNRPPDTSPLFGNHLQDLRLVQKELQQ